MCDGSLQLDYLLVDRTQSLLNAFRSGNAQRIGRCNEVEICKAKLSIHPRVTNRPVKLLGVNLHLQGIRRGLSGHGIPSAQTVSDDRSQNNGRDDRPNQFQTVVVGKEFRLAIRAVVVLRCEPKKQGVHQKEHEDDDRQVEVHQLVHVYPMCRCRRRQIVPIPHHEPDETGIERSHESQEQSPVEPVIRL